MGAFIRQPFGPAAANPSSPMRSAVLLNFREGINPPNRGLRAPSGLTWINGGTNLQITTPAGIAVSNGATTGGLQYGGSSSFDGISAASSPFCVAFEFVHGSYVNNGSGLNAIWSKGSINGAIGSYATVNASSPNILTVRLSNTTLTGPGLTVGARYRCVAGRNSAGSCWLWINGKLVASGSGATAANAGTTLYLIRDSGTTRPYQGSMSLFAMSGDDPQPFGALMSANPWSMLYAQPAVRYGFDASAGGAVSLAGNAQAIASASGAISVAVPLAGLASAVASASGSLSVSSGSALAGSASAQAAASGVMTLNVPLAGSAQALAGATGVLIAGGSALAGAATVHVSASGAMSIAIRLSGAALAQAIAAGGLTVNFPGAVEYPARRRGASHLQHYSRPPALSTGRRPWH